MTTTTFRIDAIPADRLNHLRSTRTDDAGEPLRPFVTDEAGAPLRCCLRDADAGERLVLIAYRPDGTAGAYREIGPVFVHAEPCEGYDPTIGYPEGFRPRPQIFRAYDKKGRITDAVLVEGADAEPALEKLLADLGIATIHSRNVLYGCYMFAINRPDNDLR
jgi:hypothetical protein